MMIRQLSVFLENKSGRMLAAAEALAQHGVDIRALSLADTADFGILRMIVDRPEEAKRVLTDAGIFVRLNDVLAVSMEDAPGGMLGVLNALSGAGINIEYMYACIGRVSKNALMILQTDDTPRADQVLAGLGVSAPDAGDLT